MPSDHDPSMPPPLPLASVHAAKLSGDKALGSKPRHKLRKVIYAVSLLVAGGIVTLTGNLILNWVQTSSSNEQTHSGQQYQLWQQLQSQARTEASLMQQIYSDAKGCVEGAISTWRGCAHLSPDYNTWTSVADEMDTTAGNIEDRKARRLTQRLEALSTNVIHADSAALAEPSEERVWPAYEILAAWLSELIRTN